MSKNIAIQQASATQNNGTMNQWNFRFISAVAYGFLGVGLLCNLIFYSSFSSGGSSILYATIGLLLDFAKIAFIVIFAYLIRDVDRNFLLVAACVIVWLVLSFLSLLASYGFLSQINERYEAARLKDSAIYAQHQTAVENAQAKLDNLADYAQLDTAAITTQIASYRQANQTLLNTSAKNSLGQNTGRTVGQLTKGCTKDNWYSNHYCGKAADNNDTIQQLQSRLDGHQRYQATLAHYQTAQQAFSDLPLTGAANQAHSLFINLGQLTNHQPSSVKGIYILLTSLVVELLASILMFARYKLTVELLRPSDYQANDIANQSAITLPTGTRLTIEATNKSARYLPDELLQRVKHDIATGKLTVLSFRTLQRTYQISPSTAKRIRQALLREGLAKMDAATHQLKIEPRWSPKL